MFKLARRIFLIIVSVYFICSGTNFLIEKCYQFGGNPVAVNINKFLKPISPSQIFNTIGDFFYKVGKISS